MGHLLSSAIKMSGSSEPATVTVFYDHLYAGTCATRTWSVSKNSVVQASGSGNTGASGSFTAANGDIISITCTSGVAGAACSGANVDIQKNTVSVASQTVTGFVATATATFTINTTSATYNMYSGTIA
jgi:hypothetical protein